MMNSTFEIALAGNPNAGKSSIFNMLTGSHQHVGNWPGKTVERKSGNFKYKNTDIVVVDLPGTYSLTAYSPEEMIARDHLLYEKPEVVVTVLDSANLERNLYLAVQVLELGTPSVIVLNMSDVANTRGIKINNELLSKKLNSIVVNTIAREQKGLEELLEGVLSQKEKLNLGAKSYQPIQIDYGQEIESEISKLSSLIANSPAVEKVFPTRWLAIKLLESDEDIQQKLKLLAGGREILAAVENSKIKLETLFEDELEVMIADQRYVWIHDLVQQVVDRPRVNSMSVSDRIDQITTHRVFGIPIFLAAMWVVFKLTADVSAPYLDWVDGVINGPIAGWLFAILQAVGLEGTWLESLVMDGIVAGVGGVLVFVPVLMFLYVALALLEDSGYMARAAFVMDRLMHALGLHGKSFLPMLVGFGCTVPAQYATRTLENPKDRILTGLLVPFMSCGARLPVYILFAAIFFPSNPGLVVFSMYILGIITAIILGIILKHTLFKAKEQSTFVMELPPYRVPTLSSIWFHTWERTSSFVKKAWTIIMATSIVLWFLMSIPVHGTGTFANTEVSKSAFGLVSKAIVPVFSPLGFGSWEASSALVTGLVAKEVVISTMTQVYPNADEAIDSVEAPTLVEGIREIVTSFGTATLDTIKSLPLIIGINLFDDEDVAPQTSLMASIREGFEESSQGHAVLAGLAYMVFVLIYTPCMAAVAAEAHELGMKWAWVSIIGQLGLAWIMAFAIFQGGILLGLG